MEWLGIVAVLAVVVWLVFVFVSAYRESKKVTVDSEFALRLLPAAGRPLPLAEGWVDDNEDGTSKHWEVFTSRPFSLVDARIAYESYQLVRAHAFDQLPLSEYVRTLLKQEEQPVYVGYAPYGFGRYYPASGSQLVHQMADRSKFVSLSHFVNHVAFFDSTLLDRLKARTVDPSEYELDTSGWDDED